MNGLSEVISHSDASDPNDISVVEMVIPDVVAVFSSVDADGERGGSDGHSVDLDHHVVFPAAHQTSVLVRVRVQLANGRDHGRH